MIISEAPLAGAYVVELKKLEDDRGFFARSFCKQEFADIGLDLDMVQTNISYNKVKGTLRGFHYQVSPYQEEKLVRCLQGALFDVIVDLRKNSPTYMHSYGVELSARNLRSLLVPKDFAHAFVTLEDDTIAQYQVSQYYTPGAEQGIRWNDPRIKVKFPTPVVVVSDKDSSWPDYNA